MPTGDKRHYTGKQKRMAAHIEEGYEKRGTPVKQAKARAWATVNSETKGGELKGGSGYGKPQNRRAASAGGKKAMSIRTRSERSVAAKKAALTRKKSGSRTQGGSRKR